MRYRCTDEITMTHRQTDRETEKVTGRAKQIQGDRREEDNHLENNSKLLPPL